MMKKRCILWLLLPPVAMLLAGCSSDTAEQVTDLVPISLTSMVEAQGATRTTTLNQQTDQLVDDEPLYVHFVGNDVVQLSGESLSNTTFTADGIGGTKGVSTQPYFARTSSAATLCAYHGKSGYTSAESPGTQVDNTTTSFSVALDQSNDEAYKASDLLYATISVAKSYPMATASLRFTHKMSKINVSVTLGEGISSVSAVRIICGSKTVNIANPATTNESTAAYLGNASDDPADQLSDADGKRLILYSGDYRTVNTSLRCEGLIPPQTVSGDFLQVVTSNGTATFALDSKTFAPGESYAYDITVTLASIGIITQITDWSGGAATALANGGWATLGLDITSNPLWWMAEKNMAENKTWFVEEHSIISQYCFDFAGAAAENVSGYHLPDFAEQISIVPMNNPNSSGWNIFGYQNNLSDPVLFSELTSKVGGTTVNASTSSIIGKNADADIYAIRFIGTIHCSAWHYKWVTFPCNGLLIESYLLSGVTNLNQAKDKMAEDEFATTIFTGSYDASGANLSPASTAATNNGFCQRFLPACGYFEGTDAGAATSGQGTYVRYWSATPKDDDVNGWCWNSNPGNLREDYAQRTLCLSVRLFRDR